MTIHSQQVNQYSRRNFKKRIWRERKVKIKAWFIRNHQQILALIGVVAPLAIWMLTGTTSR